MCHWIDEYWITEHKWMWSFAFCCRCKTFLLAANMFAHVQEQSIYISRCCYWRWKCVSAKCVHGFVVSIDPRERLSVCAHSFTVQRSDDIQCKWECAFERMIVNAIHVFVCMYVCLFESSASRRCLAQRWHLWLRIGWTSVLSRWLRWRQLQTALWRQPKRYALTGTFMQSHIRSYCTFLLFVCCRANHKKEKMMKRKKTEKSK